MRKLLSEGPGCDIPAVRPVIGDGHDRFLGPREAGAVAERIPHMLEGPDEAARMGERGRQKVRARYAGPRLADLTEGVWEGSGMILTTSWDDGHPLDRRLADMLARHNLPATFYVPIENPERPLMARPELRRLAEAGFEIGGHTYHHTRLLNVPLAAAREEIVSGKTALEDLLGQPVLSFCYVGGQFSPQLAALVREAGFMGARTTARHVLWRPWPRADRFAVPTTIQARNFTRREEAYQLLHWRNPFALPVLFRRGPSGFVDGAHRWLDRAMKRGGAWHLWGHSWEIERFGLWAELEQVLALVAETKDRARWLTNGQLFAECGAGVGHPTGGQPAL